MDALLKALTAVAIAFGVMLGLSVVCATIWACISWLFYREWDWSDKFLIMLEFWSEVISRSGSSAIGRNHRSSSSDFKGGSSRGGGVGRSF